MSLIPSERRARQPIWIRVLLYLTAVTFLSTWLPFLRGLFDGPPYRWENSYFGHSFSGYGTGGDYGLILLKTGWGLLLVYAATQLRRRFWFYGLLLGWYGLLLSANLHEMIQHPDAFTFRGDTVGLEVPLIVPFLLFTLVVIGLIAIVIHGEIVEGPLPPTGLNRSWLLRLAVLLPVQFLVLRLGQEDWLDVTGVLLTIVQCLLLPKVFMAAPYEAQNANEKPRF